MSQIPQAHRLLRKTRRQRPTRRTPYGHKDEEKAEKTSYGIGDAVTADKWEITVNKVDDGVAKVGDEYLGAEAQEQFVTVDLSVKNTKSDPDYFFEDNIKLGDDAGNTYSAISKWG